MTYKNCWTKNPQILLGPCHNLKKCFQYIFNPFSPMVRARNQTIWLYFILDSLVSTSTKIGCVKMMNWISVASFGKGCGSWLAGSLMWLTTRRGFFLNKMPPGKDISRWNEWFCKCLEHFNMIVQSVSYEFRFGANSLLGLPEQISCWGRTSHWPTLPTTTL